MRAVLLWLVGSRAIEWIEIPAEPSTVPTTPIIPGRSSLRITSMWGDGATSTEWSSTITTRGSLCDPVRVPATECDPDRNVTRLTYSLEEDVEVSRISRPRRAAIWG